MRSAHAVGHGRANVSGTRSIPGGHDEGGGQGTREALVAARLAPSSVDEEAAVTAVR